jgi:hypothetical protein
MLQLLAAPKDRVCTREQSNPTLCYEHEARAHLLGSQGAADKYTALTSIVSPDAVCWSRRKLEAYTSSGRDGSSSSFEKRQKLQEDDSSPAAATGPGGGDVYTASDAAATPPSEVPWRCEHPHLDSRMWSCFVVMVHPRTRTPPSTFTGNAMPLFPLQEHRWLLLAREESTPSNRAIERITGREPDKSSISSDPHPLTLGRASVDM